MLGFSSKGINSTEVVWGTVNGEDDGGFGVYSGSGPQGMFLFGFSADVSELGWNASLKCSRR